MIKKNKLRYNYIVLILFTGILASCSQSQKPADQAAAAVVKDTTRTVTTEKQEQVKHILFFGTSLTAGLGVNPEQAFPALIQHKIDSLHLPYKVINAGLSGETSAAGKNRIDWLLKQPVDIFVLELGANDGLRGIPLNETTANLQAVVDKVKKKYLIDGVEVTYVEQAQIELNRFIDKGFSSYFLITHDLIEFSREGGSFISPRGSAAGSLIVYLLGISPINPLPWGLSFSRFLSPSRGGYMLNVQMGQPTSKGNHVGQCC